MTERLIRGRVLSFHGRPAGLDDREAYLYLEDGAVHVAEGRIRAVGAYDELRRNAPAVPVDDHRPHLIVPGFIDPHIHFPQMQVIGSYAAQLLEWLNTYTFVEEQRFADEQHAARIARLFVDELIRHGTTTVAAYCSVHKASAEALFREAEARNMCVVAGKVMMDRNAPKPLTDTPQSGYDASKALIAEWHGRGRAHYAITPRFAITSSPEQMEMAGALVREHPDCHVQTHLCENHEEIAFTNELYPEARDYLDVYERYGLLGERSLFGHCIHMNAREIAAMAESRSVAVFCPTSNLFLGSGLFDKAGLQAAGVPVGVAADVGGGTSYSMLKTMDEAYKICQLRGSRLNPLESFYQITLGNARALSLQDRIGTLEPGTDADIAVLDSRATPAMALKMERPNDLAQELFLLQTMGDDRAVHQVYVAGKAMKRELEAASSSDAGRRRMAASR
ncbi:MAG: guanine deaminase [Pararhizobium sp.]